MARSCSFLTMTFLRFSPIVRQSSWKYVASRYTNRIWRTSDRIPAPRFTRKAVRLPSRLPAWTMSIMFAEMIGMTIMGSDRPILIRNERRKAHFLCLSRKRIWAMGVGGLSLKPS